eukprot:352115-Chlamydomonas_euryale.AAC.1
MPAACTAWAGGAGTVASTATCTMSQLQLLQPCCAPLHALLYRLEVGCRCHCRCRCHLTGSAALVSRHRPSPGPHVSWAPPGQKTPLSSWPPPPEASPALAARSQSASAVHEHGSALRALASAAIIPCRLVVHAGARAIYGPTREQAQQAKPSVGATSARSKPCSPFAAESCSETISAIHTSTHSRQQGVQQCCKSGTHTPCDLRQASTATASKAGRGKGGILAATTDAMLGRHGPPNRPRCSPFP